MVKYGVMIEIEFKVRWDDRQKCWRVSSSDGHYWDACDLDAIPWAIRGMFRSIGKQLIDAGVEGPKTTLRTEK